MTRIIEGEDQGEYPPQPENVVLATVSTKATSNPDSMKTFTDYVIVGTAPEYIDMGVEEVEICSETGYLATPWCPATELKEFSTIKQVVEDDEDYENTGAPEFFCHMHNLDPMAFPPNPAEHFNDKFGKAEVPDLMNMTLEDATAALVKVRLKVGTVYAHPNDFTPGPLDIVVSQNPEPGEWMPEGAPVNITVKENPVLPPVPPPVVPPVVPDPETPVIPGSLGSGPGNNSGNQQAGGAAATPRLNLIQLSPVQFLPAQLFMMLYTGQTSTLAS